MRGRRPCVPVKGQATLPFLVAKGVTSCKRAHSTKRTQTKAAPRKACDDDYCDVCEEHLAPHLSSVPPRDLPWLRIWHKLVLCEGVARPGALVADLATAIARIRVEAAAPPAEFLVTVGDLLKRVIAAGASTRVECDHRLVAEFLAFLIDPAAAVPASDPCRGLVLTAVVAMLRGDPVHARLWEPRCAADLGAPGRPGHGTALASTRPNGGVQCAWPADQGVAVPQRSAHLSGGPRKRRRATCDDTVRAHPKRTVLNEGMRARGGGRPVRKE